MTNNEYEFIINSINEFVFHPPEMTLEEIKAWIAGNEAFKYELLYLLKEMKQDQIE